MDELKGMLIKLLLDYYEHGKNLDTIAIDDDIKPILKYRDQLVSRVELPVKPACEMERPRLENFYPEGTNIKTIQSAFIENIELYNYINALDLYIDELESKSV